MAIRISLSLSMRSPDVLEVLGVSSDRVRAGVQAGAQAGLG